LCIGTSVADLTTIGLINMCNSSGTQLPSRYRNQTFPVNRLYTLAGVNADGNPNNDLLPWDNRFITNDRDTSYATGNNFSRLENWGFTLTGEIDLSEDVLLKSITGYRKSDWQSGLDGDGSPVNMSTYSFDQRQKQFSQELQLVGSAMDDKLNYVLGAYYFTESGFLADYVISGEGIYVIDGPNWLSTDAYAAFGQIDYRVNDLIGFTVGARYTKESKDFEGGQQELSGLFYKLAGAPCSNLAGDVFPNALVGTVTCRVLNNYPDPNNPLRIYPAGINKQSFNNFSPKVGIQIHPSDDVMIYGSWSKGYKTGGWTTRYSTPQTFVSSFDPEKATTYELGLKSTLLDRRLQVNAAVFLTDYNAIQLNYQVGGSPTIANVGDGKIKGAELEITAQPTRGLTLNMAVGYTDAYYTALDPAVAVTSGFTPGLQAGALVGSTLPKTPKWKVNFSPRYEIELGNGGSVTLLGDYTYISKQTNNVERTFVLNRPSVSILNASVAYRDPAEHYTITVGGTNLTGKRYLASGTSIPAFGAIIGSYNRPTEWYARIGFKF
jgi:iron complex outermembrane recepter protein